MRYRKRRLQRKKKGKSRVGEKAGKRRVPNMSFDAHGGVNKEGEKLTRRGRRFP